MAVGGGGFVVLQTITAAVLGVAGSTALATVLVALALGPLYVRAERVVDRLLYGTRPAPYRVLADITALTRSTLTDRALPAAGASAAPDLSRVAEAVARGLGSGVCRLTVHRPGLRDRTYAWTDRAPGSGSDDLVEVPVRHGAEQVGVLAVDRQAVSGLHAQRSQLLADIADGLGVVLEASRSGIELERQLRAALAHAEEIAVSRRRTVAEMDAERRRIERDLHDGASTTSSRCSSRSAWSSTRSPPAISTRPGSGWRSSAGSSPTPRRCSPRPRTGCRRSCWPSRGSSRRCGPRSAPRTQPRPSTTAG